jgi:hypothetical protein
MNGKTKTDVIRLLFELERADNPRLYDELMSFRQGSKRVNRLRTLAHEGLLIQHMQPGLRMRETEIQGDGADAVDSTALDKESVAILNQVFEAPIVE